jgi:hypothetical protein
MYQLCIAACPRDVARVTITACQQGLCSGDSPTYTPVAAYHPGHDHAN